MKRVMKGTLLSRKVKTLKALNELKEVVNRYNSFLDLLLPSAPVGVHVTNPLTTCRCNLQYRVCSIEFQSHISFLHHMRQRCLMPAALMTCSML